MNPPTFSYQQAVDLCLERLGETAPARPYELGSAARDGLNAGEAAARIARDRRAQRIEVAELAPAPASPASLARAVQGLLFG